LPKNSDETRETCDRYGDFDKSSKCLLPVHDGNLTVI
jgi:hypothetical protein